MAGSSQEAAKWLGIANYLRRMEEMAEGKNDLIKGGKAVVPRGYFRFIAGN